MKGHYEVAVSVCSVKGQCNGGRSGRVLVFTQAEEEVEEEKKVKG